MIAQQPRLGSCSSMLAAMIPAATLVALMVAATVLLVRCVDHANISCTIKLCA